MAYEQKDMSGSLFKNDRKETDSHPDYKGSALLGGVEHWLDAWINEAKDGSKYMSVKFKPKQSAGAQHTGAANSATTGHHYTATVPAAADLDDDVPF